jgi:hypothetical protein
MARALILATLVLACGGSRPAPTVQTRRDPGESAPATEVKPVDRSEIVAALIGRHGEGHRDRIVRGVDQAAALWRGEDGDLKAFAEANFVADAQQLDALFGRLEQVFEQIDGHIHEVGREVRRASDVDVGPLLPIDPLLAAYDPGAHVTEDLFQAKPGFVVLLNFPVTTLAEREAHGDGYTRRQWAETRLAGRFARRVPAAVRQASAQANAEADQYVSQYNVWTHHLVDGTGERLFPSGQRLISHWNLRDEIKAQYADKDKGLTRQRLLIKVMERIVTQEIPAAVIDNPRVDWDPDDERGDGGAGGARSRRTRRRGRWRWTASARPMSATRGCWRSSRRPARRTRSCRSRRRRSPGRSSWAASCRRRGSRRCSSRC